MNKTTITGFIVGVAFILYGILIGGQILNFFDISSIYIVIGGTLGSIIIGCTSDSLKNSFKLLKAAFTNIKDEPVEIIKRIVELSYIARKEGLLSLEDKSEEISDPFFKKGIQLAVDGIASESIREILESEIYAMEQRHKENRSVFDVGAVMAPAFGMIGTLIGLINMLKFLSTPEEIGPQMSVALVTTFYGSILSNMVFIPLSQKLKARTENEVKIKEIIIEGVISIQSGENTRIAEQKLLSYLNDKQKNTLKGEKNEKEEKKLGRIN